MYRVSHERTPTWFTQTRLCLCVQNEKLVSTVFPMILVCNFSAITVAQSKKWFFLYSSMNEFVDTGVWFTLYNIILLDVFILNDMNIHNWLTIHWLVGWVTWTVWLSCVYFSFNCSRCVCFWQYNYFHENRSQQKHFRCPVPKSFY